MSALLLVFAAGASLIIYGLEVVGTTAVFPAAFLWVAVLPVWPT